MSNAEIRQQAEDRYYAALDLMADGKLEEAVAAYRQSIDIDPTFTEAMHGLARALQDLQRYDEAIRGSLSDFKKGRCASVITSTPAYEAALRGFASCAICARGPSRSKTAERSDRRRRSCFCFGFWFSYLNRVISRWIDSYRCHPWHSQIHVSRASRG